MMAQAITEVPQQQGGLPQLNVIKDGTYTNQVAWLVLTFVVLYVVISRMVLPKIGNVLQEREENIAGNLDTAERLRSEAEAVKAAYETAVADARAKAQQIITDTKADIQSEIAKVQSELDAKLGADAEAAEARIVAAKNEALGSIADVASDVAKDVIVKLAGDVKVTDKAVSDAVSTALDNAKGA
jgi:F-type H+-transporting ATPase subunit b